MPLIAPVLDDRSFEALFAELRGRIPVYNPEWTDHHDSDVGITLLQLFAYLGEGLQFRFNQIPEATFLAFLQLLDMPLRPAQPARALLRLTSRGPEGVALYAGDQVRAGETVFTLTQDATIWPLDCITVARRSVLTPEALADPERLSAYVADLDPGVRATVQASADAVREAFDPEATVAPYEVDTLASDGQGEPLDFRNTVDGCVWVAVLADPASRLAPADLADPVLGIRRVAGRPLALSLGFAPAQEFPALDQVRACGEGDSASLLWQASLAALRADGSPDYVPLRISGDTTGGLTHEGVLRLELPVDPAPLGVPEAPPELAGTGAFPPVLDDALADRLWFWLRAWRGDGSHVGRVQLLTLNAVPCEQVAAARPQLLGVGTGQPGQAYSLAGTPVLLDARYPVRLQVEEQGVWTDWVRVDEFDASAPDDRHFRVDAEAGVVRFGDRMAGHVPEPGERIRVLGYHTGGGSAGNVPPRAIDKLGDALQAAPTPPAPLRRPAQVSGLKLGNPLAAHGGVDGESLEQALARIPAELRRNRRAVTRDDFASLAYETPGVALARAECLPLFHAPSRQAQPGCVSVVVWPAHDAQHPRAPLPDAAQLTRVCAWLDRWRLVTTELYVIPPSYRRIALAVSVKVHAGHGLDAVRDWVDTVLRQYLAPLPPHGPDGSGWPLGRRVQARELEGAVMQVEGVEYVQALRLDHASAGADGADETWAAIGVLPLAPWELPELVGVTVVDERTALPAPGSGLQPPLSRPPVPVPQMKDEC